MTYESILKKLGCHRIVAFQQEGLDYSSILGLNIPFWDGMGFPPALVPIANGHSSRSYTGLYLQNVFQKEFCFLDFDIEASEIYEIGLTENQFGYYLVRRSATDYVEPDDEEIVEDFKRLCKVWNFEATSSFEQESLLELRKLDIFGPGIPKYLADNRPGTTHGNSGFERRSREQEISIDLVSDFHLALEKENHQSAWEILNSPGWSYSLAIDALLELKNATRHLGRVGTNSPAYSYA
ncbi:hypothetical protein [Undibacterium umbellatum]|uniref:Uncharacterized protein n=1 Tax=Undibacterium umbellatum TaxID=2762300 RepID=A0ABR6Z807_9BURK|nr:hypothetical protein [Undibacterium umbellatum]MBC3907894.1 hypothetical protein [Undibacterium umbellatum]